MTLTLFDQAKELTDRIRKAQDLADIKDRNAKLQLLRTFIEPSGVNRQARIIYTSKFTCLHELFDNHGNNEYHCRVKGCGGIITGKQIQL